MDEEPFETLNVVPLVDVMLVLLTIVLTTASFVATGRLPVSLPQASQAQSEKAQDKTIEIGANGELAFDGARVSMGELEAKLAPLPKDTAFLVRADRSVPLQLFIDIADTLKRMNFTKMAVQTKRAPR